MEEKNKKIIVVSLVAIFVVIAIVFIAMIMKKNKQTGILPVDIATEESQVAENQPGNVSLKKEKKEESATIKNVTGKIVSVDIGAIVVSLTEGEMLTLKVPAEGASFVKQTLQENGSPLIEEVALFDIPANAEVDVRYNSTTNEIMLLAVK